MNKTKRYWELDAVRALAFFLMFIQHFVVVANLVFNGIPEASSNIENIGRSGAILFLLLVGVSGFISYTAKVQRLSFTSICNIFLKRGSMLLCYGVMISIVTFFFLPYSPVIFGVLSFIGVCIILLPYFISNKYLSWFFIFTAPVIGYFIQHYHPPTMNWIIFGIYPVTFATIDYWPLFPWLSVVLVGLEIGRRYYDGKKRLIHLEQPKGFFADMMLWTGSHTLFLYIIHVPLLYLLFLSSKYLIF